MIRLRYSFCSVCRTALDVGALAQWDREARKVTCPSCVAAAPEAAVAVTIAPGAGVGAQLKHDELRAARAARARRSFGRVGATISRWSGDNAQEAAWSKGAVGERKIAQRLEKLLARTDVRLLHDRRLPGSRANVDHLAIGPGGVTVIDAKHLKGKIRTEVRGGIMRKRTEHLLVDGRDRTPLIEGLRRQVDVVAELAGGAPVMGCLCLVDSAGVPLFGTPRVDGLPALLASGAAKLARRPGELTAAEVDALHDRLAAALRPAT